MIKRDLEKEAGNIALAQAGVDLEKAMKPFDAFPDEGFEWTKNSEAEYALAETYYKSLLMVV